MDDIKIEADDKARGGVVTGEPRGASLATWSSRLLVGGGLAASAIAHIAVGSAVLFASPRLFATGGEQAIRIDLVSPEELEQASKMESPVADAPETKKADALSTKTDPATASVTTPPPLTPPMMPPMTSSLSWQSSVRPSPASETKPSRGGSQSATEVKADAASAEGRSIPDPSAMADLLHLPLQMPDADAGGPPTETSAKLTQGEIAEFRGAVKKCWLPPSGIPQSDRLRATVRVALGPDGRLLAKPTLLAASASVYGPALVASVVKALAQCQPYASMPAEKYKEWKLLDLNFSQDDVFEVSPASNLPGTQGVNGRKG